MTTWTPIIYAVSMIVIAGCASSKVTAPTSGRSPLEPPVPQPSDGSWPTDAYLRIGVPDPGRLWAAADYRDCRDVLYGLNQTNRAALPRMESMKSGAVFARLINPTNTLLLAEQFLPSKERILVFMTILNRLPAFRDIYRFDAREPVLLREVIELNHAFLRMLGSAVEWDGKPLSPAPRENEPVTFHLNELSRTYNEGLLNVDAAQSVVPRGNRFIIVGAYTAATVGSFLPWLADGTAMTQADRLRAIDYLREDMPVLWPHVSDPNQRELLGDLDEVLRRTHDEDIRRNLEAFRQRLVSGGRKAPE